MITFLGNKKNSSKLQIKGRFGLRPSGLFCNSGTLYLNKDFSNLIGDKYSYIEDDRNYKEIIPALYLDDIIQFDFENKKINLKRAFKFKSFNGQENWFWDSSINSAGLILSENTSDENYNNNYANAYNNQSNITSKIKSTEDGLVYYIQGNSLSDVKDQLLRSYNSENPEWILYRLYSSDQIVEHYRMRNYLCGNNFKVATDLSPLNINVDENGFVDLTVESEDIINQ